MSSCRQAKEIVENGWADVMRVWLDRSAASVEEYSIRPLMRLLEDGQRLNDENLAKAEALAAEVSNL